MRLNWAAIIGIALLAGSISVASSAAGDPFDDSRHFVVNKENTEALQLVDSGQFPIDQTNYEGWTLLHYAAEAGNLEMVKALLERGADPTLKTKWGSTPWDVASATMIKQAIADAVTKRTGRSAPSPNAQSTPAAARSARPAAQTTGKSPATSAQNPNQLACNQKWKADYDLCSDTTCKMITYRKHAQCLKTGRYW